MSLEEFEDTMDPKTKRYIGMKSVMDFGMGIIYVGMGVFIFLARRFHFVNDFTDSTPGKIFAIVVILYGLWRIYRGFKQDYFRER